MNRRILALAEGRFSPLKSKTANGAIAYLTSEVIGVVDSTKAGMTSQQVLGYGGDIPVLRNLEEGLRLQPTHMLIGIDTSWIALRAWRRSVSFSGRTLMATAYTRSAFGSNTRSCNKCSVGG